MTALGGLFGRAARRVAYWWRFRQEQDALREELELHRELVADDLRRRNVADGDVAHAARRAMGSETRAREDARGVWLSFGVDALVKDCRYAWRGLQRSYVFTLLVVLTVALTIAANTTVFSVVQHVLLQPLPFPDGDRIVQIGRTSVADPQEVRFGIATDVLRRLQARSRTLDEFAAVSGFRAAIGAGGDQTTVPVAGITPSFLPMLRVRPMLGRQFAASEANRGGPPVVLLGHNFWQDRFAASPTVIGRTLDVGGTTRTIVGVLPERFDIPMSLDETPQLWVPLGIDSARVVSAFARLTPGANTSDASRELEVIARELANADSLTGTRTTVTSARDQLAPNHRRAIALLFVAVCGLLLIACANIATLLLMRGWSRHRELAMRSALGGSRFRLAQQLLTESVLLALLGGLLGLVVARIGLPLVIAAFPDGVTLGGAVDLSTVRFDRAVVLWTVAISLSTGLLFGLGPAYFAGTSSLADALRAGAPMISSSATARRFRNGLVILQFGLSLTFLAAAALLVRSFVVLARTPIGLDPRGLVTVTVRFAVPPARANQPAVERSLLDAIRAVPGISEAAFGGGLAQTDVRMGPFATESPTGAQEVALPLCEMPFVGAMYFRVAGMSLLQGRTFDDRDPSAAQREVIVNDKLARRLWPGRSAVGARLQVPSNGGPVWLTVVGVAADVHLPGIDGDLFNLKMYRPTTAAGQFISSITLRAARGGALNESALRRAVEAAGVSARLDRLWMTESVIDRRVLARPRFAVVVFGVFAALALVVCAAGLYGIVAYAVAQRTREIGVRLALGASPLAVVRLVLGDTARLAAWGSALGLVGAFGVTRLLRGFLYQVRPTDPAAHVGAVLVVAAVAVVAAILPTRRATRIDPIDALRVD